LNLVESLSRASSYLERHGVSSPRLNAELLLCHVLDAERIELYTNYDRPLAGRDADTYRDLLIERAGHYPLQYITGEAGFRGLILKMARGVFIPRPETEILVEKALEVLPRGDGAESNGPAVLDLGAGCGNVTVSIAVERPRAVVTATDVDPRALELCEGNARRFGVSDRVATAPGDLYEALDGIESARFDLIVSNPPYIPDGCRDGLEPEVTEFEPPAALFGGEDGLDVVRRIVEGAPRHLASGGWLVMEVGEDQAGRVVEQLLGGGIVEPGRARGCAGEVWAEAEYFTDLSGRPRVVRARLGSRGEPPA
jgi:release factor glutamine methyltransferase